MMNDTNNAPGIVHNAPVSNVGDHSPHAVVNDRTGLWIAILSLMLSCLSLGSVLMLPKMYEGRMEAMSDQNRILEREVRVMQDDFRYIRAYLSARGVPLNHEEAEGK